MKSNVLNGGKIDFLGAKGLFGSTQPATTMSTFTFGSKIGTRVYVFIVEVPFYERDKIICCF